MKYSTSLVITVILTFCSLSSGQDFRKWLPENGVAVRQSHFTEWFRNGAVREVGENAGEVGIVWSDTRGGVRAIYSQVIDVDGNLKYADNGLLIASNDGRLEDPVMWADPDGGWFYAWEDFTNDSLGDIYCTKINSEGEHIWNEGIPVVVVVRDGIQEAAKIVHDGEGGCIIAWRDMRDDVGDIYATHIVSDGRLDPEWAEDGMIIVAERGAQTSHTSAIDGAGGMIIGWKDGREVGNSDIWAERISPDGNVHWGDGAGIPICNQDDRQETPKLCSDGAGGAFFSWVDERNQDTNKDIYVQRIDANGELLWSDPDEGIPLVTEIREQVSNQIVLSEAGTAIITWEDSRGNGQEYDVYAMSISGVDEMELNWESPIVTVGRNQIAVRISPDGEGGIYAVWEDERDNQYPNLDIWAQRLDRDGEPLWGRDGIPINTDDGLQAMPIISRHALGCAVFYSDNQSGSRTLTSLLLQPDGDPIGDEDGMVIMQGANGNALNPQIHSKGNGQFAVIWLDGRDGGRGQYAYLQLYQDADDYPEKLLTEDGLAIFRPAEPGGVILINSSMNEDGEIFIVTEDHRRGQPYAIYAQKVSSDGEILWDEAGVRVAEFEYDQNYPFVVSDGDGGVIVAWRAPTYDDWYDIYLQRLNEEGEPLWGADGILVTENEIDERIEALIADGEGGAVVLWNSDNDDTDDDLWINRINADGELMWGNDHVVLAAEQFKQQDPTLIKHQDGYFIAWRDARDGDRDGDDIWGQFINTDGSARWLDGGIYICNAPFHQVNTKAAIDNEGNIWVTWADNRNVGRAGAKDIYIQKLGIEPDDEGIPRILLTDDDGNPYIDGMPLCSEDGTQTRPYIVHDGQNGMWIAWDDYRTNGVHSDIYATHIDQNGQPFGGWAENGNVVSDAPHRQNNPQAVLLTEDGESGIAVVWMDKRASGKEELSSIYMQKLEDEFEPNTVDGADFTPTDFSLDPVYPNPFNSTTRISYSLPSGTELKLSVIDLSGRIVNTLYDGYKMAGVHHAILKADNLTSGLYFVRLQSQDVVMTQKMMLIK